MEKKAEIRERKLRKEINKEETQKQIEKNKKGS